MLLVEKQIGRNIFAQIKRYRKYDFDGETVIGFEYAIQTYTPQQQVGYQRVGTVSRYASYDTLKQAQAIFTRKYGDILPRELRGAAKANYLKRLEMSNDSDASTEALSQSESQPSQVKTTKPSVSKPKKVGVLDRIRSVMQDCNSQGFNRAECIEYATLEGFKKSSITRVANEIFGKPEKKASVSKSTKVVSIQPSTNAPSPIAPRVLDLRDRLKQQRAGWDSHLYDVDADLSRFQSRRFVGTKKFVMA